MQNKTESLISMAQLLAAARYGAPIGIPETIIGRAVDDCADLLGAIEAERLSAIDEIKRRTNISIATVQG
jgi:hypothetical protein